MHGAEAVSSWEAFAEVIGGVVGTNVMVDGINADGAIAVTYYAALADIVGLTGGYSVTLTLPNGTHRGVDVAVIQDLNDQSRFETVSFLDGQPHSGHWLTLHNYYEGQQISSSLIDTYSDQMQRLIDQYVIS